MTSAAITGLEGQLESAYYGTGPDGDAWYVPSPSKEMDLLTLGWMLEKLNEMKADISAVLAAGGNYSTQVNGGKMIELFNQRINQYTAAIDRLNNPVEPGEDPGTEGNKMSIWFIIGAAVLVLFSISASNNKR